MFPPRMKISLTKCFKSGRSLMAMAKFVNGPRHIMVSFPREKIRRIFRQEVLVILIRQIYLDKLLQIL